jgi:type IV pilus assembly protein PilM
MGLPFLNSRARKRDQIVAIDLGSRTTKAVHLQRRGGGISLLRYAIQDAPIYEKSLSPDLLSEHLKSIVGALDTRLRPIVLSVGVNDSILRNAELPQIPVSEMRAMLKFNTKNYLQQDLPNHVFDCYIVPPRAGLKPSETGRSGPKYKVWVGGGQQQLIENIETATKNAGLIADAVTLSLVGPVNAFEMANPEIFSKEVVALVDIGFKHSSISILDQGELMLNRVVGIGGDRLTSGLAETLAISYAEAEGIKVGMPSEVESTLLPLLTPLGRELRASIDFFEHQEDKTVSQVFLSGGSARSEFIVQSLQTELMVPCVSWSPTSSVSLDLPPQQIGEVEQVAPQLTVALGAAAAVF